MATSRLDIQEKSGWERSILDHVFQIENVMVNIGTKINGDYHATTTYDTNRMIMYRE